MSLSFVGSLKCYTFVKFVTSVLYQYKCVMSINSPAFSLTRLDRNTKTRLVAFLFFNII